MAAKLEDHTNGGDNLQLTPDTAAISLQQDNDDDSDGNRKRRRESISGRELNRRKLRRLELLLTVPSYTLAVGGSANLRHENRARLWYLLRRLVSQHNWLEATGVLSALLKATCHERTAARCEARWLRNDRMKYSVAMELRRHMEDSPKAYSTKIEDLYHTWRLKIRSYKGRPPKDRYVLLDHIVSSFARKERTIDDDAFKSLKVVSSSGRDPMLDLVLGLASYEVWYSGLPEEMRERNLEKSSMPMLSETMANCSSGLLDDNRGDDVDSINDTCSDVHYYSEASVVNDNCSPTGLNQSPNGKASRANVDLTVGHHRQFQTEPFSEDTVGTLDDIDCNMEYHNVQSNFSNAFNVHALQSLLPFRVPFPDDMVFYSCNTDCYYDAVKNLKLSLQAPPPVAEASLLPLVQLLVVGDQVDEAFLVLQQFCNESNSALPFRLRARLQESVENKDSNKLASCLEDVIEKDPTCRRSLRRLIDLHQMGTYAPESLMEMISLHLEATYGDPNTWREFALCLRKISICDTVSMCMNGEEVENEQRRTMRFSRIPAMFVEGLSGKTWKLRCKWWLHRHFSNRILTSEIEKGEWELMAYKAASASHLYGKDLEYVVKVHASAKKYDRSYLSFLRTHMENSFGFFPNFVKKRSL